MSAKHGSVNVKQDHFGTLITVARECRYSIQEMARRLNVSVRSFELHCQAKYKQTPRSLVTQLRLNETERLVLLGQSSKQIADALSYGHLSNFSRWLKCETGLTFRDFARKARLREMITKNPRIIRGSPGYLANQPDV